MSFLFARECWKVVNLFLYIPGFIIFLNSRETAGKHRRRRRGVENWKNRGEIKESDGNERGDFLP